jgi:hypothetical protein
MVSNLWGLGLTSQYLDDDGKEGPAQKDAHQTAQSYTAGWFKKEGRTEMRIRIQTSGTGSGPWLRYPKNVTEINVL